MDRWTLFLALCVGLCGPAARGGEEAKGQKEQEEKTVVLSETRQYRLEVAKLHPLVLTTLSKQWTFEDAFPRELLARIKESPRLERWKPGPFAGADEKPDGDSGHIRWALKGEGKKGVAGLLWYIRSEKRRELVVSVDLSLGHVLGAERLQRERSFDQLRLTVDLGESTLSDVRWGEIRLPDRDAKSPSIDVADYLQVRFSGVLTKKSSESIRSADDVLADEVSGRLRRTWRTRFENLSHHGITLGWLAHEALQHGLVFLANREGGAIQFQYSVSGGAFPLALVRRQLEPDGWPLVLRGTEYVGSSNDGVRVFRPVEYMFSRTAEVRGQKSEEEVRRQ